MRVVRASITERIRLLSMLRLGTSTRRALNPGLLHGWWPLGLIQRLLDALGDTRRLQALTSDNLGRSAGHMLLRLDLPPIELLEEMDFLVRVRELREYITVIPQIVD